MYYSERLKLVRALMLDGQTDRQHMSRQCQQPLWPKFGEG